jgi:hypothetical protein
MTEAVIRLTNGLPLGENFQKLFDYRQFKSRIRFVKPFRSNIYFN